MSSTDSVTSERVTGRVKWFNNKAGYGFITVTDGSRSGTDVFIHHSAINVESQQYKYLVQGEYVNFDVTHTESGKHEWQASLVGGINNGKLMCETRREYKLARTTFQSDAPDGDMMEARVPRDNAGPRRVPAPRARGEGPRERQRDGGAREWKLAGSLNGGRGAGRTQRNDASTETR